jgi:hypothetical protein
MHADVAKLDDVALVGREIGRPGGRLDRLALRAAAGGRKMAGADLSLSGHG